MTAQIRYEDVRRYIDTDTDASDLETGGFHRILALFMPILDQLCWVSSSDALDKLAYYLDDNQRQWLTQLAAAISEETNHVQKEPRFGEYNSERIGLAFWRFVVQRRRRAWDEWNRFDHLYQAT